MRKLIVRVVNIWNLPSPFPEERPFLYVGKTARNRLGEFRNSGLGNPFWIPAGASDAAISACLERYKGWLDGQPRRAARIDHLLATAVTTGLPLGCWCADWDGVSEPAPLCHAVVLAKLLMQKHRAKGVCS